jgi:hypothetical protein
MIGPAVGGAVAIDAFTGAAAVTGNFAADYRAWALAVPQYGRPAMRPDPPDPANWADPQVGWGLVLPEPGGLTPQELATAGDAPEPIQALVTARRGKVLRYRSGAAFADWTLRDYTSGDLLTAASPVGTGPQQIPKYLLIYGNPGQVPWYVQYGLNPVRCVGRLDLTGDALANYVTALLDDWSGASTSYTAPVVWAVDHGGDITTLMRQNVAEPVSRALSGDNEMLSATYVDGSVTAATAAALADALEVNKPSFILTSSHGMTGPLIDDGNQARATLGYPVDADHQLVTPEGLLAHWQPDGAIWFAQACCSAGSDSPTAYSGLFEAGSLLDSTLTGIARLGAMVSPLPRALLGASKPLRAFVGHVEPTFDWTLSFPPNRQVLTNDLTRSLYTRLCSGQPVGLAMTGYYPAIGSLLQNYLQAKQKYDMQVGAAAKPALDMLVYSRVTAHDRASTVILGDPTVAIPLP